MRKCLAILIAPVIALCLASPILGAEPTNWRIKHFDVVQAEPWDPDARGHANFARFVQMFGFDTMDRVEVKYPLTTPIKQEMEAYLHDAAGVMQEWGFPEPFIHDIVTRSDGLPAYRIYYTNVPDLGGQYSYFYKDDLFVPNIAAVFIDADSAVDEGGVKPIGYHILAHELFHAVQYATPFFGRDMDGRFAYTLNPWLAEGQADAVSLDILRRLKPEKFKDVSAFRAWGQRNYSNDLVVKRRTGRKQSLVAYRTASFWRYLAEVNCAKMVPNRCALSQGPELDPSQSLHYPGPEPHPVDYSYLADFLQQTTKIDDGDDELDWLDAMVRGYSFFKVPLRDYFAEFLVAYADYGDHRLRRTHVGDVAWLYDSFSLLPVGGISDNSPTSFDWTLASLNPFIDDDHNEKSASKYEEGCYGAVLTPAERYAAVPFHIRRNSGTCIDLLLSDFEGETPVTITLRAMNKKKLGQLRIGIAGELRTSKTSWIKNDDNESRTRHNYRVGGREVTTFVISNMASLPSETISQTAAVVFTVGGMEMGDATPTGDSGTTGEAPSDDPEAQTRERMARAAPRVTKNGPGTTMVKRRERQQETVISLGSIPEAFQLLDEVNLSGSGAGLARGQDTARQAMSGDPAVISAFMDSIAQDDRVKITIPLIDYGFTGSFDNAEVKLTRHRDEDLHALDLHSREPNGQVTIDVYAPDFLSGSFSAHLVERAPRSQPLVIVRTLSGRFWVPTPWLMDGRSEIEPVDSLSEDVISDVTQWMPGSLTSEMNERLQGANQSGPDPSVGPSTQPSATGASSAAGGALSFCSCACVNREAEALRSECEAQCETVWQLCETPEGAASLEDQLAELRSLLAGSGLPQASQDMMIESFEKTPPSMRETVLERFK